MTLPIASTLVRIRSVCLLVLVSVSLLAAGCARGPRATLADAWGRTGGVLNSAATSDTEEGLAKATANAAPGEELESADTEEGGSILEAGRVLAVFSRQSPHEEASIGDPFQNEFAVAEKPTAEPDAAVAASFTTGSTDGAAGTTVPAHAEEKNPFAEYIEQTADEQVASDAAPASPAGRFEHDIDSQMERLRALMAEEPDAVESPGFMPLRAEEIRAAVNEKMKLAKSKIQFGRLNEALRIAKAAQQQADEAELFFGPNEDKPAELVSLVHEMLEALRLPVPETVETQPAHKVKATNPFESVEAAKTANRPEVETPKAAVEATPKVENPFEADFEPKFESVSPNEQPVIRPAEEYRSVHANDQPQYVGEDHPFRGVIVPGPQPGDSVEGTHAFAEVDGQPASPVERTNATSVEIDAPVRNPVTLGPPTIEEIEEEPETDSAAALVPAVLTVPDALPEEPDALTRTAALLDDPVSEPPFIEEEPRTPAYVTALDPIDWELEPAPEPDAAADERRFPVWFGIGLAVLGLFGIRAVRRNRKIARR